MHEIIPAILVQDEQAFRGRLLMVEKFASIIQIDVMNGTFVPNTSWCDLDVIDKLDTTISFELHLMIEDPEPIIQQALKTGHIKRIIWHVESMGDHRELLNLCQSHHIQAGLALSPKTPPDALLPYIGRLDEILILGVEPGFSGQALLPETIDKTKEIHDRWPDILLGFDGGITLDNLTRLAQVGIQRFCVGSGIFNAPNPEESFHLFQTTIKNSTFS